MMNRPTLSGIFSALTLCALSATFACTVPLPLGAVCQADDECDEGFTCLQSASARSEDSCEEGPKVCSKTCDADADCEDVEASCVGTCDDAVQICLGALSEGLPFSAVCDDGATCDEGLECLPLTPTTGVDTCGEVSNVCTVPCTEDTDCEGLGDPARCVDQCNGDGTEQICIKNG